MANFSTLVVIHRTERKWIRWRTFFATSIGLSDLETTCKKFRCLNSTFFDDTVSARNHHAAHLFGTVTHHGAAYCEAVRTGQRCTIQLEQWSFVYVEITEDEKTRQNILTGQLSTGNSVKMHKKLSNATCPAVGCKIVRRTLQMLGKLKNATRSFLRKAKCKETGSVVVKLSIILLKRSMQLNDSWTSEKRSKQSEAILICSYLLLFCSENPLSYQIDLLNFLHLVQLSKRGLVEIEDFELA